MWAEIRLRLWCAAAVWAGLLIAGAAAAGEADVLRAEARCNVDSICHFSVTLRHADVGWQHYADRFEVLSLEGHVLGVRILRHPHVHEQPFTRVLREVAIPRTVQRVRIRARDSQHGYGGAEVTVDLTRAAPPPPGPAEGSPGLSSLEHGAESSVREQDRRTSHSLRAQFDE